MQQKRRADQQLDCRGLLCPLPAQETRLTLDSLPPGAILEVVCTDPASPIDLRALCDKSGHRLLDEEADGELLRFWIERSPAPSTDASGS